MGQQDRHFVTLFLFLATVTARASPLSSVPQHLLPQPNNNMGKTYRRSPQGEPAKYRKDAEYSMPHAGRDHSSHKTPNMKRGGRGAFNWGSPMDMMETEAVLPVRQRHDSTSSTASDEHVVVTAREA